MKTVEVKLYQYSELGPAYKERAWQEYCDNFISKVLPVEKVWFTWTGLIYPIFNN